VRKISLYAMCLLYTGAGINHVWHPAAYIKIMPAWPGHHESIVLLSGVLEIVLGLLLLPLFSRRFAACGIMVLLVCVFPANVQMMLNYAAEQHPQLWMTILRLPLQVLLLCWAYGFTRHQKPSASHTTKKENDTGAERRV
jgi:uncharacterized membrane protein